MFRGAKYLLEKFILRLEKIGTKISEEKLIVLDYRSIALLFSALAAFFILTLCKINYSSIGVWDNVFANKKGDGGTVLLGTPKEIRSDEYRVVTPFMLSQAEQNPKFPVTNESLGAEKTPLLMSLPVSHFSTWFRPQNWGFFFLDIERAYAFYWNFKVIGLIVSFFLFLMLLTRNNFWISFLGSLWLFFSSYVQWWFSTPAMLPEMISSACLIFVGLSYILFSQKIKFIFLGALTMLIFGINFILFFYPPFQITMVYLYLFIFAGYLWKNWDKKTFYNLRRFRIFSLFLFAALFCVIIFKFYQEARSTIEVMMQTSYPGKRAFLGGETKFLKIFSGYFDAFFSDKNAPKKIEFEGNFVIFFPVALVAWINSMRKREAKKNAILYFLALYIFFILVWIFIGLPQLFAKITLMDMVHPHRAILGLGMASVIFTTIYLAESAALNVKQKIWSLRNILYFILFFVVIFFIGEGIIENSLLFLYLIFISSTISFLAILLLLERWKSFFILLILLIALPNFPVNPINYGLGAVRNRDLVNFIKERKLDKMNGKWVVFGKQHFVANLIKAAGAPVVNGVNFLPDLEKNRIMDSENQYREIHNRYANIGYSFAESENPVFSLDFLDHYTVVINPCSEKIKNIGVRYLVLPKSYAEPDCLTKITQKPLNKMHIYTYKD